MKMKVFDQLHISGVNDNKTMGKNHEFEVSDSHAKELMDRGQAFPADMTREAWLEGRAQFKKDQGGAPKNKQHQLTQNKIIGGKVESKNQPAPTVTKSGKGKGKGADAGEADGESTA